MRQSRLNLAKRTIPKLSITGLEYKIKCYRDYIKYVIKHGYWVEHNDTSVRDIFENVRMVAELRVELNRRKKNPNIIFSGGSNSGDCPKFRALVY